jgi:RNA polymerase sigma-70 factor (ECF subfamily)
MLSQGDRDQSLVGRALEGDKGAFDALFDQHLAMVRGEARRHGVGAAEDDVVQETFLRAYLNLPRLRNPARFACWLRRIAQRVSLMELRDRERALSAAMHLVEDLSHNRDHDQRVRDLLDQLPPAVRQPIYLHHVLGLDAACSARVMGLTPGAFRTRLHRARTSARKVAALQHLVSPTAASAQSCSEIARRLLSEGLAVVHGENPFHDWSLCRRKLEQAVQADPDYRLASWLLARKLSRDGDCRQALKLLRTLWKSARPDPWLSLTMAWTLDYMGRRKEALKWYALTAAMPSISETHRATASAGIERPQVPKARPPISSGLIEVPHDGWSAKASHDKLDPRYAIDGDRRTRWCTIGSGQAPGMWLRIDLGGQVDRLAGIWLDDDAGGESIYQNDAPRHCVVSVSRDGQRWKRAAEWHWQPNRYMEAWWKPVSARCVMLEQTAHNSPECWSVYEAHVYRSK